VADLASRSFESVPFARGSISFRLYPHNELPAGEVVAELCGQAGVAFTAGFDGVMTSEHHGGFAGYLPNPLQMVAFILDDHPQGWAAACPLLLPLRPTAMVAEEVAWLGARHPGRVGLGVAAGALPLDFETMGVPVDSAPALFASELPRIVDMLRGQDLRQLGGDPALSSCARHPIPVLSAAVSTTAAQRAARCGAGILLEGMSPVDRLARVTGAYDEAGGAAPKVIIRRVWLGELPTELVDRQREIYDSYAGSTSMFGDDQTVHGPDPVGVAEQLVDVACRSGADALNLRVHLPGMSPVAVRHQILMLGTEVLPAVRALWSERRSAAS
jgi:alkanesulfonate monooxygenase SsuD/methylene tetrahydromethanopterin reductase-like flavin-dependent oxidoreductase (luciferase family)